MFAVAALVPTLIFLGSGWLANAVDSPTTCQAHLVGTAPAALSPRQFSARNASTGAVGSFCENTITLQSDGKNPGIFNIDHGVDVGGLPTFQVVSRSGDTSVFEATYSETRALLENYIVC